MILIHLIRLQIKQFLAFVKRIYSDLPKHLMKIFEPRQLICVKDLKDLDLKQLLSETYTITTINVTGGNVGNVVATVSDLIDILTKDYSILINLIYFSTM